MDNVIVSAVTKSLWEFPLKHFCIVQFKYFLVRIWNPNGVALHTTLCLTAPSAGVFLLITCSGWIHQWQLGCDWLLQEEAAMTHWMLHRVSSTASAASKPPSSSLSFSLSLFSPTLPLLLSLPSLLSISLPFPLHRTDAGPLGLTAAEDIHTLPGIAAAAAAASGLVGVLRPVSLPPAAQARHHVLLWSPLWSIWELCVCLWEQGPGKWAERTTTPWEYLLPLPALRRISLTVDIFTLTCSLSCNRFCMFNVIFMISVCLLELLVVSLYSSAKGFALVLTCVCTCVSLLMSVLNV